MIEQYWNEVFGDFKNPSGKFEIPGFPEPMLSTHFGIRNIIGPTDKPTKQSFKICMFGPLHQQEEATFEELGKAISKGIYWRHQVRHNSEVLPFIKRFLPFVLTLETPHYHFFVRDDENILATAIVGVSESGMFLFNLSVDPDYRKMGLAREIIKKARGAFPEKPLFYWTVHPWLRFDSKVLDYHLLSD
ncbi:GNAT family N-acetyltransferase [Peredibacter starrii]|uniref:GNAT family N-acetyltransferase n=1 Tax=Peredibacter starrii TaxID=28202 RepID=A0AAX4HJZ3_9BACT|nr:GNAT family N-acetyltransferase [Peredibacter starrii]WPU63550.1 GNAT family N-acetyltransferase [Peredibacter starrii]